MRDDDVRASTASAYDEIVDDFVRKNSGVSADFAEFRASFVALVAAGGVIADLGCGPGRDAAFFRDAGLHVVAFDASRGMARHARGEGVRVALADLRRVPVRGGHLDGIFSAASLLHVPREDVPRALRGWCELLRPGGVLGLSTSLGESEGWEDVPYELSTQPAAVPRRRWFVHHDRDALLEVIEAAQFEVLDARERVSHRRWLQVLARVTTSER